MLTPVERVLILRNIDLLQGVGPRDLAVLAGVAREEKIWEGQRIYGEEDLADCLYVIVEGRVRISTGDRLIAEMGPGEAFGTWSLVDDSARGQAAVCVEDGIALALEREGFYEAAADSPIFLKELLRVLARRLRKLVEERPEEAQVEGERVEKPELVETATAREEPRPGTSPLAESSLEAAVLDRPTAPPLDMKNQASEGSEGS